MYCVITKNAGAAGDLSGVTAYGPFISELLAQTFAKKRLPSSPAIVRQVVRLAPDISVDAPTIKLHSRRQDSNRVKVTFPEK